MVSQASEATDGKPLYQDTRWLENVPAIRRRPVTAVKKHTESMKGTLKKIKIIQGLSTVFWMLLAHWCWGKLLLKVMHYNIVLLHEKVTNCAT